MKFYKNESSPIERIELEDLELNDLFISSDGTRYEWLGETFITDKSSALVEGETVEELTPKQLKLYWNIMRKL